MVSSRPIALVAFAVLLIPSTAGSLTGDRGGVVRRLASFEGSGSRVIAFDNDERGPVALRMLERGDGVFSATLQGKGRYLVLVNALGSYSGETLVTSLAPGSYRLAIEAGKDVRWSGGVSLRQAPSPARSLAGSYSGTGDRVYQVHNRKQFRLRASAACRCTIAFGGGRIPALFRVTLANYRGDDTVLFNHSGRLAGKFTMNQELSVGDYLVAVEATGPWSLDIR